jgi:hypothetical protein
MNDHTIQGQHPEIFKVCFKIIEMKSRNVSIMLTLFSEGSWRSKLVVRVVLVVEIAYISGVAIDSRCFF